VFGNTVDSLATGNVAAHHRQHPGHRARRQLRADGANVQITATGASVAGDMIATTYQTNVATNLLAGTQATQIAVGGNVVGCGG